MDIKGNKPVNKQKVEKMFDDVRDYYTPPEKPKRNIAGCWKRIGAWLIDMVILAVVGGIIGLIFWNWFIGLGGMGRIVGLVIAVLYWGIFNSSLRRGQTIGKQFMKLQTVDQKGECLSPPVSFLRATVLALPLVLKSLQLPPPVPFFVPVLNSVIIIMGIGILYFYIFNKPHHQSLHDIICGSYVTDKEPEGVIDSQPPDRKHFLVYGGISLILLLILVPLLLISAQNIGTKFTQDRAIYEEINSQIKGGVVEEINRRHRKDLGINIEYLEITVLVTNPAGAPEEIWKQARKIGRSYDENITVYVKKGVDLGIFGFYFKYSGEKK